MCNKYQKVINKLAKEDVKKYSISLYSVRKSIVHMFNGFKGIPIERIYKTRRRG